MSPVNLDTPGRISDPELADLVSRAQFQGWRYGVIVGMFLGIVIAHAVRSLLSW